MRHNSWGVPCSTVPRSRRLTARIATSRFEEYGGRPPYAKSIGSGKAVVLRHGRAYTVRWSRPDGKSGTTYTLPNGQGMLFAPGQTWVVLAPDSHASYLNAARV